MSKKKMRKSKGCGKCRNNHALRKWPAFGKDCRNCGGKNHFAKCCYSKKNVQLVEKKSDKEDDEATIFVDSIEEEQITPGGEQMAHMDVNVTDVTLKLETGAQGEYPPYERLSETEKKTKNKAKKSASENV